MRDEYMTEKTPPLPEIEPCALCGKEPVVSPVFRDVLCAQACFGDQQFRLNVWNETQRRITSELRKAFEAGFCQVLKLGTARPEDVDYYWPDYLAERKA